MLGKKEKELAKKSTDESKTPVCDVCGQSHSTESCLFISCHPHSVEDAVTPSHARLTLPNNLIVKDLADGTTTVTAKARFVRGTRFGPFVAPLTSILPPEVNFPLKIFGETEENSYYLDTRNEDNCNWMCLVAPVFCSSDIQNLFCYQVHDKIFFSLVRDIELGEELKVWYAPFYAVKMGIPGKISTIALPQFPQGTETSTKMSEPVTWEADTTTADLPTETDSQCMVTRSQSKHMQKRKQIVANRLQSNNSTTDKGKIEYVAKQLPPKCLGARFAPSCWRCRECGAKEESVINYAHHLMQHLKPPNSRLKNFPCSLCHKKFFTQKLLDEHEKTRHSLPVINPKFKTVETSDIDDPMPMESDNERENQINNLVSTVNDLHYSNDIVSDLKKNSQSQVVVNVSCVLPRNNAAVCSNSEGDKTSKNIVCVNNNKILNNSDTPQQNTAEDLHETGFADIKSSTFHENSETSHMSENINQNLQSSNNHHIESFVQQNILQPFSETTREVPETILNHEFFTHVAGDSIVQDVKSLLSLGYSLQFLVENEDGTSSLVDVLSTQNNVKNNPAPSSTLVSAENPSQQLVIVANGNVSESLPLALRNFLPSTVPILSKMVNSIVSSDPPIVPGAYPSKTSKHSKTNDIHLMSCLDSESPLLKKQDSTSDAPPPLGRMLPSAKACFDSSNKACFDSPLTSCSDSNLENVSLMDINLGAADAEREALDYELDALDLPLPVGSNCTNCIINSCTSPSPAVSDSLCIVRNMDLNTPNGSSQLLDQISVEDPLSADVIGFNFGADSQNSSNVLSSQMEVKSIVCEEGLTKDFSDLIAADADSNNVLLSIQPADSTAELRENNNGSEIGLRTTCEASNTSLKWMESEELMSMRGKTIEHSHQNLSLSVKEQCHTSKEVSVETNIIDNRNVSFLKDGRIEDGELHPTRMKPNMAELFMCTHQNLSNLTDNLQPVSQMQLHSPSQPYLCPDSHSQVLSGNKPQCGATPLDMQQQFQSDSSNHHKDKIHCSEKTTNEITSLTEANAKSQVVEHNQIGPLSDISEHQTISAQQSEVCGSQELGYFPDTNEAEQSFISSGPPFICDICNKSFGKVAYLYRHLRKHTGEFTCVACHAVFARKESLQLHECAAQPLRSSGSERLSCPFCPKQFAARKQLTRHLANHAGTRHFECSVCNSSFSSKDAFELHSQKCTNNEPTDHPSSEENKVANGDSSAKNSQQAMEPIRCDVCRRMFLSRAGLQRHKMTEHQDPSLHECVHCGRVMNLATPERLEHHTRFCAPAAALQAGNADVAVCPECNEPFRQLLLYRQHTYRHTHPYSCAHCQRSFHSLQERGKHVCLDRLEQCCICGHRFGTVIQLERHALTHGVPNYHCFECGRSFHLVNDFNQHRCFELNLKITRRVPRKPVEVESSNSSLVSSTSAQKSHNQRTESDGVMCEFCGEVFKSKRVLKSHLQLHGERKIECTVCGKRFHRKDVLVEHMYVHEAPQLRCVVCNKLLKSKKSLDVHIRQQHFGSKRFSCHQCGKEFHQKENLRKHMRSHDPRPEPVSCPQCGRRFRFPDALAKHVSEHVEEPQFSCAQCDQKFLKEKMLRQHMKIHVLRGYSCPACGHTLKHRNSLRRHIVKHHPELTQGKKAESADHVVASDVIEPSQGPEVLLTVSQLQLTTEGVQPVQGNLTIGNSCVLEQDSVGCSDSVVLYIMQEPFTCLPIQDSST